MFIHLVARSWNFFSFWEKLETMKWEIFLKMGGKSSQTIIRWILSFFWLKFMQRSSDAENVVEHCHAKKRQFFYSGFSRSFHFHDCVKFLTSHSKQNHQFESVVHVLGSHSGCWLSLMVVINNYCPANFNSLRNDYCDIHAIIIFNCCLISLYL